jgi:hypothetical protein
MVQMSPNTYSRSQVGLLKSMVSEIVEVEVFGYYTEVCAASLPLPQALHEFVRNVDYF